MTDESKSAPPAHQEQIQLSDDMRKGVFANQVIISHSPEEFVLDYVFRHAIGGNVVVSRVILTPEHSKRLAKALMENIQNYERVHGPIKEPVGAPPQPPGSTH